MLKIACVRDGARLPVSRQRVHVLEVGGAIVSVRDVEGRDPVRALCVPALRHDANDAVHHAQVHLPVTNCARHKPRVLRSCHNSSNSQLVLVSTVADHSCCVRFGYRENPSSQLPLCAALRLEAALAQPDYRSRVRLKHMLQTFISLLS